MKLLDKKDFNAIRKELDSSDKEREKVISKSRDIIKFSKQIIYSLHRNEFSKAGSMIKDIIKMVNSLPKDSFDPGIASVARQEYVEAICFYYFVKEKKIPTRKQISVDTDSYLLGLCDLSGELVRNAVNSAITKDFDKVKVIKDLVDEIYGEFLKFDLRNGELRKKSDSIKWNLNKLQELLYNISINR